MNEMLPNPLFWRQGHIFTAQNVENLLISSRLAQFYFVGRQIYFHFICIFAAAKVQNIFEKSNGRKQKYEF